MILIVDNHPAHAERVRRDLAALGCAARDDIYVFATAHQLRIWLRPGGARAWGRAWTRVLPPAAGVTIIADLNVSTHRILVRRTDQQCTNLRDLHHIRHRLGVTAHLLLYTHHPVEAWGAAACAAGMDAFVVKGECTAVQIVATIHRLQWQVDYERAKYWQVVWADRYSMHPRPQSPLCLLYVDVVLCHATYEHRDDGMYAGSVPGYRGIAHTAATLERCRLLLRHTLEQVIADHLHRGQWVPVVNGINVNRRPMELRDHIAQLVYRLAT